MNVEYFIKQLNEAQDLMKEEKYEDSIVILERLKIIEEQGKFDYKLTHKLYQLLSNSHSFLNQKTIVNAIQELLIKQKSISIKELNDLIKERTNLNINDAEFRREIEILILRGILPYNINGNMIIF
ncbi:MAG: hypothetical protein ACFFAS_06595 [Promethearchaeota archaeon]